MLAIVTREQGKDSAPFIVNLAAENGGHGALAIEIEHEDFVTIKCGGHSQMRGSGCLANAAFEIRHSDHFRR